MCERRRRRRKRTVNFTNHRFAHPHGFDQRLRSPVMTRSRRAVMTRSRRRGILKKNAPLPHSSYYTRSVTCHTPHANMRGGQRGGWWLKDGLDGFVKWNTGWMKRAIDRGARLRTQQQQRGGRVPTLDEGYCRRVLHGSKLKKKKKKSGVTGWKRKKRNRRRGIM